MCAALGFASRHAVLLWVGAFVVAALVLVCRLSPPITEQRAYRPDGSYIKMRFSGGNWLSDDEYDSHGRLVSRVYWREINAVPTMHKDTYDPVTGKLLHSREVDSSRGD